MTFSIGQVLCLHAVKCYVIDMDHIRCNFRWLSMVLPCCALCMVIKISFAGIKSSNPKQGN